MCEYRRGGHKKGVNIEWGRGGGGVCEYRRGGGSQEGSEYRIGAGVTRSGSRWVKKE